MAWNYRCCKRDCRHRITLAHKLEWYIREPVCKHCKRPGTLRFDPWVRQQTIRRTCKCMGVHFPHRRGTVLNDREFCLEVDFKVVGEILVERGIVTAEQLKREML